MQNIEIKVQVPEFETLESLLKERGALFQGVLEQADTYFRFLKRGRLKMRVINNQEYQLIYYVRPDVGRKKLSNY